MSLEWFRDLVICIWGLVTTGVFILIAVLAYSLYRKTMPILDSETAPLSRMCKHSPVRRFGGCQGKFAG